MKYLIRLLAAAIARKIERGSLPGAAAGAVLGIALAWAFAMWLRRIDAVGDYWVAIGISSSLAAGLIGAMTGSIIGPKDADPVLPAHVLREPVRVTNYNRALAPLCILFLIAAVFGAMTLNELRKGASFTSTMPSPLISGGCFIALLVVACRTTVAITVSPESVVFNRPILSKRVDRSQIRSWKFGDEWGRQSTVPPTTTKSLFTLELDDGTEFFVQVSPSKAIRLAHLLDPAPKGEAVSGAA